MSAGSFTRNLHVLEKRTQARFFVPGISRFAQPDSIVPGYTNPQNLNRYAYTLNNPLRYTDPSGHIVCDEFGQCFDGGNTVSGQMKTAELGKGAYQPDYQAPRGPLPAVEQCLNGSDSGGGPQLGPNPTPPQSPSPTSTPVPPSNSQVPMPTEPTVIEYCPAPEPGESCGEYYYVYDPVTRQYHLSGIGGRFDISAVGGVTGADFNFDLLLIWDSLQLDVAITPGSQTGAEVGGAATGGLLLLYNVPNAAAYSGGSYTVGANVPLSPGAGLEVESSYSMSQNPDGTIPTTIYIGAGVGGEGGVHDTAGYTYLVSDIIKSIISALGGN